MALDGSIVAAIVTGIAALIAALATAWMSGWNEHRTQARANKKALARYSVPLIIAAWDLSNWFFDILDEDNYSPKRCAAYGDGWSSEFTSYLIGSYFAGVHIIREMTHFFAHIRGEEAENLKKTLWKIQDEFISMDYEGRESREMRWFEGDILAAQEHLTEVVEHSSAENTRELRVIGWTEFQKKYELNSESRGSPNLHNLFSWYEDEFQRIVYRRFRSLYTNKWPTHTNPQAYETMKKNIENQEEGQKTELEREILREARSNKVVNDLNKMALEESSEQEQKRKKLEKEEESIMKEQQQYPQFSVIVPDHRVRRLQHLLMDLVEVLDAFTTVKLNRPVRRCTMLAENRVPLGPSNPLDLTPGYRIPCDCSSRDCNPKQEDFLDRKLSTRKSTNRPAGRELSNPSRDHLIESRVPPARTGVVDAEKGISQ
ncbi:hypothetical protein AA0117_g9201 [Alternaria alternata]|jgi:hypothetical protein|uniref:Uncharacterized protein n=1 Tax=Alternaria alternata TaxID=5599 RepID=A0A4Q4N962_ALTAL|nr:hypothetical protein AA0117_g9201 [Alternaria alternata]